MGEFQDQEGGAGAKDHGRERAAGWHLPCSRHYDGGRDAVQMDPDPVHQAQMVPQDLHPVRSDGAEPYRAVYREAEGTGAANLRHREVLCHTCQDPLRAICARCEAGPVQEAEEAAAVQHFYPRSPHAAENGVLLCGRVGPHPQDSPAP